MSGVNAVEVIAEALAKHYAVSFGVCLCGWRTTLTKIGESWRPEFDAHQASVIAALPNIAIVDASNAKSTPEDQRDDAALAYWPRIQAAIRGAAVGRADMDYLTPECHRKNCKQCGISNPTDLGQAFGQMKHRISETILDELYSGHYSDPDAYYGEEVRAAGGES